MVTITAENHPSEAGSVADDRVAITVADTGVGIAADVLDKVFDPFFTTKPVGKGTGLGLSQVHGFANQAGGSVRVESDIGKGTRVTLLLPREQFDEANAEGDSPLGSVLLVEDNPDVAMASTGLLEQLGYSVTWAADAESALSKIELERFNVVFSDIVMPGKLDGLGLAKHLKEHHPALPVLLATGYSDAARKSGSDFPILRKPYQLQELSRALATLLR
jgi:CheY-like chemotaxis protein